MGKPPLPDGLVAFVKRSCPTCETVEPVLAQLGESCELTVFSQDDPAFPESLPARARREDDTSLRQSWHHDVEVVPTLLRVVEGVETARIEGWQREEWETFTGVSGLGPSLPDWRPGCGSRSVDPDLEAELAVRFGGSQLQARRVHLGASEDEFEAMAARGWSDGLPVVPPTPERVTAMLAGTSRKPDEVVAVVPPDLVPCTVEKVAINAVLAGCRPEALPVVLAALEAVCTPEFNIHGLLATTMPVGPVVVVNGPIRRELGMSSGINVLGQGNRANLSIGRALQLVVRNVGGGRPGEIDRATFGNPGKLGFCFAEDEEESPWTPLSADLGAPVGANTVTVFPGEGPRSVLDQLSRDPESLCRSYAACIQTVHHPKVVMAFETMLCMGVEHSRIFRAASWDKAKVAARISELTTRPGEELVRGAGGMAEGLPEGLRGASLPKLPPDALHIVHCGGRAGLFGALLGGWLRGEGGRQTVWKEITR